MLLELELMLNEVLNFKVDHFDKYVMYANLVAA